MTGNDVFANLRRELNRLYAELGGEVVEVADRDGRNYVGRRGDAFLGPVLHAFNGWAGRLAGEPPDVISTAIEEKVPVVR